jgi:hypothetical protein
MALHVERPLWEVLIFSTEPWTLLDELRVNDALDLRHVVGDGLDVAADDDAAVLVLDAWTICSICCIV